MASSALQEWSDSDQDEMLQTKTSVLLGIPDGPLEPVSDLKDAAVSRIGGVPVRLITTRICSSIFDEYMRFILAGSAFAQGSF
jgi:hypothetical protein